MDDERKARRREYDRQWRAANKDKIRAAQKKWAATPEGKSKRAEIDKRWRENNPERRAQFTREYHRANKTAILERNKWYKIERQFGLTREQWLAILEAQGGKCAACGATDPGGRGWQTDHCQAAGHIRGILCLHCNTGIGLAKENPATLQAWINYLRR
jgi:Recombination endonuclease VII